MLDGQPPFVLSDALPGDLLPIPVAIRLFDPPSETNHKAIKRGRWIRRNDFLAVRTAQSAGDIPWNRLLSDEDVLLTETTRHNTLARDSDASLGEEAGGGGLFSRPDTFLRMNVAGINESGLTTAAQTSTLESAPAFKGARNDGGARLSLYFRAHDDKATDLLLDLLYELSLTGFGADIATGRGQFEIVGEPEPAPELDAAPKDANGLIVLSTFQPAPGDPVDGYWEAFPKFGKVGPDLGLTDVRKHTLIMFRPGACFRADSPRTYLGRALPMNLILPESAASALREGGVNIIHPAFGLAVPMRLPEDLA